MNTAEWILVVILCVTLFVFLVLGIILIVKFLDLTKEAKQIVIKSQDIAENTNGIVSNIKGMTSIGGVVQSFADKYTNKLKKEAEEAEEIKKSAKKSTK